MASPLDKRIIFGLLHLWIRDSGLPLTPKTERYVKEHCRALVGDEDMERSGDVVVDFIRERKLGHWLVQRLRQFRPKARRTRYQRDLIYGRPHPRANVTSLDKK